MAGEAISKRLDSRARERLRKASIELDDTVEAAFADTIGYGTQRLVQMGIAEDATKVGQAESSVDQLVSSMIEETTKRGARKVTMLAFNAAIAKRWCRIFPFCEG